MLFFLPDRDWISHILVLHKTHFFTGKTNKDSNAPATIKPMELYNATSYNSGQNAFGDKTGGKTIQLSNGYFCVDRLLIPIALFWLVG